MSKRRVVITGLGMLSPLGLTVSETWKNLLEGKSGIATLDKFDITDYPTKFAGEVKGFDPETYGITRKDTKRMDGFIQYGMAAAEQAWQHAGIEVNEGNTHRIGVMISAGIGGLATIEANYGNLVNKGPRKMSPFFIPASIINMISGNFSIKHGLTGPNLSIVTACTTGVHNIGQAARIIAYGDADVMVAGGAEMASTPMGIGGFSAAKALSTRNDAPEKASRPWDQDRDGFVLADGAGVVIMEDYEHAKARGANIYAEVTGFGMSGDAYHMTSPPADGAGAALAMKNALQDAGKTPEDVDYINAHGTSTPVGDLAEATAVKAVFAEQASKTPMSSTKSMTGHLLGAAGAVETIFSIMAICDNAIPPTINLDNPDENCLDLDLVPHTARQTQVNHVLCNSFGFGGTNGSVLLSALD